MNKIAKLAHLADRLLNPSRSVEVFGMFGPGNLGDEAMLVAARAHLPRRRLTSYQTYFDRPILNVMLRHRPSEKLLVGGGTLVHGGETGWLDYVEMRSLQGVGVSFLGTGLAFLPEQVEGRSSSFERWSEVLARAENVYLRGPQSVALAQRMCGRGEEFGDFAFLLHDPHGTVCDHRQRDAIVGVNLGLCLGDQEDFEKKASRVVQSLAHEFLVVFHAVVESDIPVIHRVIARSGLGDSSFRIEADFFDPFSFMAKVNNYRAFIGLKLHAAGLALISGVPSLFIAYQPKCADFVAPLGDGSDLLIQLPLDVDEVVTKVGELFNDPRRYCRVQSIRQISARQREIIRGLYGP